MCSVKVTSVGTVVFFALTQTHNCFATRSYPVNVTLFEVSQKFTVRVYQVASVVMETTQLVLSRFKTSYRSQLRTE